MPGLLSYLAFHHLSVYSQLPGLSRKLMSEVLNYDEGKNDR